MLLIEIGHTLKPHGVKGELKLKVYPDFLGDLRSTETVFIEHKGQKEPFFVDSIRGTDTVIAKFEDIDSPESAKKLSSKTIYLRDSDIKNVEIVEEDDSVKDFEGFLIIDETYGEIGKILEVQIHPHQALGIVAYGEKEIMIPLVEDYVMDINLEEKTLRLDLPEGLLDL